MDCLFERCGSAVKQKELGMRSVVVGSYPRSLTLVDNCIDVGIRIEQWIGLLNSKSSMAHNSPIGIIVNSNLVFIHQM